MQNLAQSRVHCFIWAAPFLLFLRSFPALIRLNDVLELREGLGGQIFFLQTEMGDMEKALYAGEPQG